MTVSASVVPALPRALGCLLALALGLALSGCADMSDNMSAAFADPAQYELYDCKQLETARKGLAERAAQLQGLMAKAETGTGGAVVSELATGAGGARGGLGYIIYLAPRYFAYPRAYAALVLLSLSGIVIFLALSYLSHLLLHKWHESALKREN